MEPDSGLLVLATDFDEAFVRMKKEDSWWPGPDTQHGMAMRRLRELSSPLAALHDRDFLDATYRSLNGWHAFRGVKGGVPKSRFESEIEKVAPLLLAFESLSIIDLDLNSDAGELFAIFSALEDLKPSRRKWVATSKALYHLLPDLVLPMDNMITARFLGHRSLPVGLDQGWLSASYSLFVSLAKRVGRATLEQLARSNPFLRDRPEREAIRLGHARVIDFAMAGSLKLRDDRAGEFGR